LPRLLVGDDPQQTPIAEQAFLAAIASAGVYLPDVVLAEVAWVLRGYDLECATCYYPLVLDADG
jgi:predicted nucleic-acid-binding protein